MRPQRFLRYLTALALLSACGAPTGETVDEVPLALDVCAEAVPANRAVDGIPAYAQCDATMDASIWSNNGVDTSLTSLGSDWVQTQRGGGYQCTELAYRYMRFRWNVSYRSGNAAEWCDGQLPANLVKATTPVHGDLIVFAGGVCGADATTGHIAVVDTVDAARAAVTIVEENRAGRRSAQQSCATCFLHGTANDGSIGGAAGAAGTSGTGGMAPAGGTGSTSGTGGTGGVSEPATGGTSGASTGTGGSIATGGSGGSGLATGGTTTGGAATGGAATGGTSADAGSGAGGTGTPNEPAATDETLDSGCSVSGARRSGRETSGHAAMFGLILAFVGWRRARRR